MMDDRRKSATETSALWSEADAIRVLGDSTDIEGVETLVPNGDDAAVIASSLPLVFCVDSLVEGQDFRRDWASFEDVGWKLGATNLSDLAAMGASPLTGFLSLGVPNDVGQEHLRQLRAGLEAVWSPFGSPHIVGGDLSKTEGPFWASLQLVGQLRDGKPMRRCRVQPGDLICVSGNLGEAAAGLYELETQGDRLPIAFKRAQLRPRPRVSLGIALSRTGCVASAIDISDGFLLDLRRLLGSEYGTDIDSSKLPVASELREAYPERWLHWALHGGEDFELIFCVARENLAAVEGLEGDEDIRVIGTVTKNSALVVDGTEVSESLGFDHFRS